MEGVKPHHLANRVPTGGSLGTTIVPAAWASLEIMWVTYFDLSRRILTDLHLAWKTIGPPTTICTYAECTKLGAPLTNRKH
jgi:hypothetical protein